MYPYTSNTTAQSKIPRRFEHLVRRFCKFIGSCITENLCRPSGRPLSECQHTRHPFRSPKTGAHAQTHRHRPPPSPFSDVIRWSGTGCSIWLSAAKNDRGLLPTPRRSQSVLDITSSSATRPADRPRVTVPHWTSLSPVTLVTRDIAADMIF